MPGWGQIVTVVTNLIRAFIVFLLVRWANRLMRSKDPLAGPTEVDLLTEIRNELRRR
jgi:large conductance mechanosensitive channel